MEQLLGDAEFWQSLGADVITIMLPLFMDMFEAGQTLGSHQKPRAEKIDLDDLVNDEFGGATPELAFDAAFLNQSAGRFIENYTNQWWNAIERSTRDRLRSAIQNARTQGLGVEGVMAQISDLFTPARAMRIATSELTNLLGAGEQAVYANAGFPMWEWRTVMDARVDPICEGLEGRQFPMSRLFEKAHVNCRCFPVPVGQVLDMPQTLGSPTPLGTFQAA